MDRNCGNCRERVNELRVKLLALRRFMVKVRGMCGKTSNQCASCDSAIRTIDEALALTI